MVRRLILLIALLLLLSSCGTPDLKNEPLVTFPDTPPETTEVAETHVPEPAPTGKLEGKIICIDPGHGIFEKGYSEPIAPGASETKAAFVSGTSGAYQSEAEFNLKLAYLLKPMLEGEGAVVYMTRTTERAELSNVGRAEYANELGCDMVVRIHADGASDTSVSGILVLVPGASRYFDDTDIIEASKEAGQRVLDSLTEYTGAENKGLIERTDLTGFNWTRVPCILIECGFMSNPDDDLKLADESYRKLLAEGITKGLTEYYMTVD